MENNMRLSLFKEIFSNESIISTSFQNGPFLINHESNSKFPLFEKKDNWTLEQKLRLFTYLQKHYNRFVSNGKKQKWRQFKEMARYIKTRNVNQCRNYFIKIKRQFSSLKVWSEHLINELENFQEQYFKASQQLQELEGQAFSFELPNPSSKQNILPHQYQYWNSNFSDISNSTLQNNYGQLVLMGASLFASYGQNCNDSSMPINVFKKFYPSLQQKAQREAEFRQCHRLFQAWWQKVNELIEMDRKGEN